MNLRRKFEYEMIFLCWGWDSIWQGFQYDGFHGKFKWQLKGSLCKGVAKFLCDWFDLKKTLQIYKELEDSSAVEESKILFK